MESRGELSKGLRKSLSGPLFPGLGVPDEILLPLGLWPTRLPFRYPEVSLAQPLTVLKLVSWPPKARATPAPQLPTFLGLQAKCCQNILLYLTHPSGQPCTRRGTE